MHRQGILKTVLGLVPAILLAGCVTVIVEPGTAETGDLATVAAEARSLAARLGKDRVLVVFDIDNTLLAMEQGLGSDQWYEWQKEISGEAPCDERVVADRLAVQGALYFASAMRPTQENAPELVRDIQEAGIPVIALTSRGVEFRLQTFRELRRNGLDFRRSAIGPDGGWQGDFIPDKGVRPARYEDGVFLTSGQHKGVMLHELLLRTGAPLPDVIVMIDDKQDNLDAVAETFAALGVTVRAWRYTGEDGEVAAFDPDAAHRTLQYLLPALQAIEAALGTDNFDLPDSTRPAGCAPGS